MGIRDQVTGLFPSILTKAKLPLEMAMLTLTQQLKNKRRILSTQSNLLPVSSTQVTEVQTAGPASGAKLLPWLDPALESWEMM